MKNIVLFLFTITILLGCSQDDDDNSTNSVIVGEWKLMRSEFYGINPEGSYELITVDYRSDSIIYNFRNDGTLDVSGEENMGYPNGSHIYFFGEDHLTGQNDPMILLVKINDLKWTYQLTDGEMRLGQTYVDGIDLIFEKK